MSGRVFVVIPVHNRCAMTLGCLESLRAQQGAEVRVIVVDDGSTDGTSAAIAEKFPETVLLEGDGNLWWTGATAKGVEWVLGHCSEDDYVLTLNNDTKLPTHYIETLVRVCREAGGTALVGSVAVDARDADTIFDGGTHVDWTTAKWWSENKGASLAQARCDGISRVAVQVLAGRGTLVPVSCIRTVGNYDARMLPHYGADYEFSARAAGAGYPLLMSYEAPVYSEVEATGISSARGRLPWRAFLATYASRRSPACLLYRWRFGRLAAPRGRRSIYMLMDTLRVTLGGLRAQLRGAR